MAGETGEIRRNIAATREEIDEHLQQLSGQVRSGLDVERRARENMPSLLAGAAILGLALGILSGGSSGRRREHELAAEQARLAREWSRLAKKRARMPGALGVAEVEEVSSDIP